MQGTGDVQNSLINVSVCVLWIIYRHETQEALLLSL